MKDLKISKLNDVYGELLTDKQRKMAEEYYNLDLSLAEIAENYDISRQAVHSALSKVEKALYNYENKIGYLQKFEKCEEIARELETLAKKSTLDLELMELAKKLRS